MDIEFTDGQLALIETDRAADTKLPVAVIQTVRQRLSVIRAAPDFRTMQNWKSLGLRALEGSTKEHAIGVALHWTLVLRIEKKNNGMKVIVEALKEQLRGVA